MIGRPCLTSWSRAQRPGPDALLVCFFLLFGLTFLLPRPGRAQGSSCARAHTRLKGCTAAITSRFIYPGGSAGPGAAAGKISLDQTVGTEATERTRSMSPRRPGVAFLMSAILPGAGQLYNGDHRGYLYLGLEAGAWFARLSYLDAGNTREGEYESFARRHWEFGKYRAAAGMDGCTWSAADDSVLLWFNAHDMQQYYEEIGKYDKYRCGWDDFSFDPDHPRTLSPNRSHYRDMRKQSNDLLSNARLALAVAVVNRVISGVDAFRSARRRSESLALGQNLRLENGLNGTWRRPKAFVKLVWELP
jgi:hypothetical protein